MSDELKGGVEALMKPFTDLLDKLAGPAAEELGLTLQDHVRMFRLKRQIRLFGRVKEMLAEARIEPSHVPFKLLLPMVESAAIEENDDLQDKWAAMLTNAAGANGGLGVEPVFPLILKELGTQEVKFLDELYEESIRKRVKHRAEWPKFINVGYPRLNIYELKNLYLHANYSSDPSVSRRSGLTVGQEQQFRLSFDIILRNRLLDELYDLVENRHEQLQEVASIYRLSALGARFIQACQTPKPGEPESDGSANVI